MTLARVSQCLASWNCACASDAIIDMVLIIGGKLSLAQDGRTQAESVPGNLCVGVIASTRVGTINQVIGGNILLVNHK